MNFGSHDGVGLAEARMLSQGSHQCLLQARLFHGQQDGSTSMTFAEDLRVVTAMHQQLTLM